MRYSAACKKRPTSDAFTCAGEVVEGMDVVKAVEAVGSASGAPTQTVTIVESGVVE